MAFAAIGLAVLDLSREILTATPPRVVVVPTVALDPEGAAALAALFPGADVEITGGTDRLSHRLARSRLLYPEDPALVLMWTGRFDTAEVLGSGQRAAVLTEQATVPLDPDDVEVRLVRAPAVNRPGRKSGSRRPRE